MFGLNKFCHAVFLMATHQQSTTDTSSNMKRVLCLHGRLQSASIMSNKIAGARRKLERRYELHFLDAPLRMEADAEGGVRISPSADAVMEDDKRSWWERDANGKHVQVQEAFEYVVDQTNGREYDAVIGFSQGGLLATALVISGKVPGNIKAVVTAGAPMVDDVFHVANALCEDGEQRERGLRIPKLHMAGRTDKMVPVESTQRLCTEGGTGTLIEHEKGHLFPTRALFVNQMLDFLEEHLV